ncbi:phage/plasmid replication domain-containing protein [Flavobacterium microcysteis]|uniref:Replication-associated protein G2P N-terminal domain-containing protein n=1 Tax=Flavobacterium microcysteis TaxID=2596891 RepID=A0A501QDI0_9FLAO|nr:phage/plasmid replication protein [Flavobacterium microcysteis]TPD70498.1 hypothetical protein FJA49_06060 [Flavobacterium microcysteis]
MVDTITFVLHHINQKEISLNAGVKDGLIYKSGFNRLLYERLCEYESQYIERTTKYYNEQHLINPDDKYFLSKTVKKVGLVTRHGAIKESMSKSEFYFYPVRGDFQSASSEYRTKFSVSENSDSITFELSIPKFLYNNNIAQFVPNIDSKRFKSNPFGFRDWYGQKKALHDRIGEFILTFFNELCIMFDMPVTITSLNLSNIEIKRLDFCYNQVFPCHASVLDYLDAQRKFYKTRVRKNTLIDRDCGSSFYYRHATDGFFFKIYSKGEEFEAVDLPRLVKENEAQFNNNQDRLLPLFKDIFKKHFESTYLDKKGKVEDMIFQYYKTYVKTAENRKFIDEIESHLKYKISFLRDEAMKILRYEMSFTRTYMSTLYKKHIFRKTDSNWKELERAHNKVQRYNTLLSQGSINQAKSFLLKNLITKPDFLFHDLYDKSLHKKHEFYLETDRDLKLHEKSAHQDAYKILSLNYKRIPERKEATFSKDLLLILIGKFYDEIEAFQVKKFDDVKNILETIDNYNEKAQNNILQYKKLFGENSFKKIKRTEKRKKNLMQLNKPRLKIVLDKMDEGKSIEQICDEIGLAKSSKYELQKDLKMFNIFKGTVKSRFNHSLIKTDFHAYYLKFYTDRQYHRKLFPNPFMVSFDTTFAPMLA